MDLLHLELFYNGCESTDGTLGTFIFLFASYLSEKDDSLGYIGNYLLVSHIRHHTDSTFPQHRARQFFQMSDPAVTNLSMSSEPIQSIKVRGQESFSFLNESK